MAGKGVVMDIVDAPLLIEEVETGAKRLLVAGSNTAGSTAKPYVSNSNSCWSQHRLTTALPSE